MDETVTVRRLRTAYGSPELTNPQRRTQKEPDTMKTKTAKPFPQRLGLIVTTNRDRSCGSDFFTISASVVTIGNNAEERARIDAGRPPYANVPYDKIRNVRDDDAIGGLYLGSLTAQSLGSSDSEPRHLYSFELEYKNVGSVDQRKAEQMAATLKTITKRMDAYTVQFGRPQTFGQFVARVARAVAADSLVFAVGQPRGWSYDDNAHNIRSVEDGIHDVDQLVDGWVREKQIAEERRAEEQRQAEYRASVRVVADEPTDA